MKYLKTYESFEQVEQVKSGDDNKYIILRSLQGPKLFLNQVLETIDTHSELRLLYIYLPLEKIDRELSIGSNVFDGAYNILHESDDLEDAINNLELIYNTNNYNL